VSERGEASVSKKREDRRDGQRLVGMICCLFRPVGRVVPLKKKFQKNIRNMSRGKQYEEGYSIEKSI